MARRESNPIYSYIESLYKDEIEKIAAPDSPSANEQQMQIAPFEGMILRILLKSIGAKNVLEIGTLLGYSTIWLAKAVGEDGNVVTIEKSEATFLKASKFLEGYKNIKCINSDAISYLQNSEFTVKFDAVFIDADKTNYSQYFDLCLPLVRSGGLIIADNTLMCGEVLQENPERFREKTLNAIREFNQKVSQSSVVDSILLPTNSGLTIALKK
jgi:predicted O-methyltransferase YrrM